MEGIGLKGRENKAPGFSLGYERQSPRAACKVARTVPSPSILVTFQATLRRR
jgi:hypothetical protein